MIFATIALVAMLQNTPSTTPVSGGSSGWWADRHRQKLAESRATKSDLIFIGDSITHAWEDGEQHSLWKAYFGSWNPLNLGFSGDKTQHVLWRLQNGEIDGQTPKAFVILIGTNNIGNAPTQTPEDTAEGIKLICTELIKRSPRSKIVLLSTFPRSDKDPTTNGNVEKINASIKAWRKPNNVITLDISPSFKDSNGQIPLTISPDRLHLSSLGYYKWAEAILPTLQKFMPKTENLATRSVAKIEEDGYDWERRHSDILVAQQSTPDLVFIGDSIFHNFGGPAPRRRQFGSKVWDRFYGARKVLNLGFGYDRTQNVLWRLENGELKNTNPKLAVLLIGTNNLSEGRVIPSTDQQIADAVVAVAKQLNKNSPKTKILLLGLLPRGGRNDMMRARIEGVNRRLSKLKLPKTTYLDLYDTVADATGEMRRGLMLDDKLHPSEAGYQALADALEPHIAKVLGKLRP